MVQMNQGQVQGLCGGHWTCGRVAEHHGQFLAPHVEAGDGGAGIRELRPDRDHDGLRGRRVVRGGEALVPRPDQGGVSAGGRAAQPGRKVHAPALRLLLGGGADYRRPMQGEFLVLKA